MAMGKLSRLRLLAVTVQIEDQDLGVADHELATLLGLAAEPSDRTDGFHETYEKPGRQPSEKDR